MENHGKSWKIMENHGNANKLWQVPALWLFVRHQDRGKRDQHVLFCWGAVLFQKEQQVIWIHLAAVFN